MGYIIYVYSRDRGRQTEWSEEKKGWGEKRDRMKKKDGDTYKSEAGGRGCGEKGCEYKNERGNEAALEKKKSETHRAREQRTD